MEGYARMGVELVEIMPLVDPLESVRQIGKEIVPALETIG